MNLLRTRLARNLPPKALRRFLPPRLIFYGHVISDDKRHPALRYYNFPARAEFEQMIGFVQDAGYRFVSLADYVNLPRNGDCLLTFDDGFREVRTVIHPILSSRSIPYAIFVCGGSSLVPCRIRHLDTSGPEFLTLNEIADLKRQGVHIGFHGNRHELMSSDWTDEAILDLIRPAAAVAEVLSAPRVFAYPFQAPGNCDRTDALIRSAGFSYVFGTEMIKPHSDHLSRISMDMPPGNVNVANTALYGLQNLAFSRSNIRRILAGT